MIDKEESIIIEDIIEGIGFIQSILNGINVTTSYSSKSIMKKESYQFNIKPSEIDDHLTYGLMIK